MNKAQYLALLLILIYSGMAVSWLAAGDVRKFAYNAAAAVLVRAVNF